MEDPFKIRDIPSGSILILLGDFFREPNDQWKIAAYFISEDKKPFRKPFPIDALPFLAVGSRFPITVSA